MSGAIAVALFTLGVGVILGSFLIPFLMSMLRRYREDRKPKIRLVETAKEPDKRYNFRPKRRNGRR